jgi:hypothetical protein
MCHQPFVMYHQPYCCFAGAVYPAEHLEALAKIVSRHPYLASTTQHPMLLNKSVVIFCVILQVPITLLSTWRRLPRLLRAIRTLLPQLNRP